MKNKTTIGTWIGFVAILVWCLLPVVWIISLSFKSVEETAAGSAQFLPKDPTLDNYRDILSNGDFLAALRNSFGIAVIATFQEVFDRSTRRSATLIPATARIGVVRERKSTAPIASTKPLRARQPARETPSVPEPATRSTLLGTAISPPDAAARCAPKCRHASMLAGDSIANIASTCSRCDCVMSMSAPALS